MVRVRAVSVRVIRVRARARARAMGRAMVRVTMTRVGKISVRVSFSLCEVSRNVVTACRYLWLRLGHLRPG